MWVRTELSLVKSGLLQSEKISNQTHTAPLRYKERIIVIYFPNSPSPLIGSALSTQPCYGPIALEQLPYYQRLPSTLDPTRRGCMFRVARLFKSQLIL